MAKVQHFPGSSDGKECTCKCGRLRFDPWVRKIVGKGNVNLLQYSCLENTMDRRATGWLWSMGSQRWDTTEQLTFTYMLELHSWLVWSPCCPRDSQESSPAPSFESINSWALSLPYGPTLAFIHDYWKNYSFDYMDLLGKIISLFLNMLSMIVIAFLPRSKHLFISWLQSLSLVILEPKKENLSLLQLFPLLFSMTWWDWMPWS